MAGGRKPSASRNGGSRTASAMSDVSKKKKSPSPEQAKSSPRPPPDVVNHEGDGENVETASIAESDIGSKADEGSTPLPAAADLDEPGDYHEPSLTEIIVTHYDGNRGPTGLYDGYGEAHFVSSNSYKGNFEKGQMQGKGIYTWNDGMRYEGDFLNNHISGYGMYKWPDASSYEGEVSNGLRHGVGVFRSPRQSVSFSGQWFLGKRHGRGMMNYGEQSWYEGDWVNNARHGYGIRRYKTGNVFEGHWTNDKRHGEGTMRWIATNETYRGTWENGVQHGYGTHTWYLQRVPGSQYPLRNEYVGEFVNGLRHGRGKFFYASGAVYDGEWENGRKSGWGKFIFNNGRVFEGQFDNDHMVDYPTIELNGAKTPDILQLRPRTPTGSDEQDLCSDSLEISNTQISGNSLKLDIDTLLEEFPESERSDELKHVTHLTLRNVAILRRAYTFYSALGHDQSLDNTFVMTRFQFWRFLKDCKVHHTQKSLFAMDRAIASCHTVDDLHNPMEKMLMREFFSNVIILAHFIYKNEVHKAHPTNKQRNILSACLDKLLAFHISKYACNVKGYFLSEQRRAITALGYMDRCWQIYLAIGTPNTDPPHDMVVKMRHFLLTLKDLGIVKCLPASKIVEVLCQDDPNVSVEGICNLELDMTFLEFFEALIGCAVELEVKPSHPEKSQQDIRQQAHSTGHSSPTETISQQNDESHESPTRSISAISRTTPENPIVQQPTSSTSQLKLSSTTDTRRVKSTISQTASKQDLGAASTGALLEAISQISAKEREDMPNADEVNSEIDGDATQHTAASVSGEDQDYSQWANKLHYFFNVLLFPAWDHMMTLKNEAAKFRKEESERLRIESIEKEMERRRQNLREPEKSPEDEINKPEEETVPEPQLPISEPTPAPEPAPSENRIKQKSGKSRRKERQ